VDKKNKHLGQEDDDSEEDDETSDPDTPERMKERRKKKFCPNAYIGQNIRLDPGEQRPVPTNTSGSHHRGN
jgi:hypothetical protein